MSSAHENRGRRLYRFWESILTRWPRLTWKSWTLIGGVILIIFTCFLAGSYYGQRQAAKAGAGAQKILYYVDPMNPAHTSPEPGLAPCGMKMEPVYADEVGDYPDSSLAPGSVRVTPRKQQLIGVRLAPVEKAPFSHALRALGRVAVDETRIFRLNASTDGWIREVGNNSTGSVVKKDEILATFYSPEFLAAQQAYIYSVSALDRFQASGQETPSQIEGTKRSIQQYVDSLHNLGMSDLQLRELENSRRYTENILMVAPVTSFVLARNVSPGQRYTAGTEWYRLADLSRVWVVVDLYENEAGFIRPGEKVRVSHPYQKKVVQGVVSDVLPQFDPTSRTLKVRLEVENPDFALRPDMFMDVDFPVTRPETISVPAEAVLDTGLRKTVFVDRGEGFFEPRSVETGWRLGGRVQILKGLQPGEKIVVSGNFLIDSESRMKLAAAGLVGDIGSDIVCGKLVDERKAEAEGRSSKNQGKAYFFCSEACKQQFDQDPGRYDRPAASSPLDAPGPAAVAPTSVPVSPTVPEPVVASPPPGWQPPVIPSAPPMPMAAPPAPAGAPVIKHPPAANMPVVRHPEPSSGPPPNLNVPSVSSPPFSWQPPGGPGAATADAATQGQGQQEPARQEEPHQQPSAPKLPGSPKAHPAGPKSGGDQCHD
jgi:membrane fusion protein, copper/silver efflux system